MKNENSIMIGLGVVVAAIGFGLLYFNKKGSSTTTVVGDLKSRTMEGVNESAFPLVNGSKGDEVRKVQRFLNLSQTCKEKAVAAPNERVMAGTYYPLDEDGIFGNKTAAILGKCYSVDEVGLSLFKTMASALDKMIIK